MQYCKFLYLNDILTKENFWCSFKQKDNIRQAEDQESINETMLFQLSQFEIVLLILIGAVE